MGMSQETADGIFVQSVPAMLLQDRWVGEKPEDHDGHKHVLKASSLKASNEKRQKQSKLFQIQLSSPQILENKAGQWEVNFFPAFKCITLKQIHLNHFKITQSSLPTVYLRIARNSQETKPKICSDFNQSIHG